MIAKDWVIRLLFCLLSVSAVRANASSQDFYFRLAEFHAPIVYQQMGRQPVGDTITRVDFDGDLAANNNWDNLSKFETPAYVYYSVIESKTHYFVTYAFFHPRDYKYSALGCMPHVCHENDLEGSVFTIKKDRTEFGHIILVESLAHDDVNTVKKPLYEPSPRLDLPTLPAKNIVVWIEAAGHGVHSVEKSSDVPRNSMMYFYGAKSDIPPRGIKTGQYSYALLSVETEWWDKRNLTGTNELFSHPFKYEGSRLKGIEMPGSFAGYKYCDGCAHPPWAWSNNTYTALKKGDWFIDPVLSAVFHLGPAETISSEYIYNPYIGIE